MSSAAASSAPPSDSLRDTFESLIIALILAFTFRAFVVEAFIIPTGSMAPTLLGAHVTVTCDQCGQRFFVDAGVLKNRTTAVCPMCYHEIPLAAGQGPLAGDRILVLKYLYAFSEPRRWDVVVFKYPNDPSTNYIKRLVGLPGEELLVVEGNVYAHSLDPQAPEADRQWHIERKTVRPKVQRAVWQPLYHSEYYPLDQGQVGLNRERAIHPWRQPWIATAGLASWDFSGGTRYEYRSDAPGQMRFDFESTAGRIRYAYNEGSAGFDESQNPDPLEDVRVAARFEPSRPGLAVAMQTTARWSDPHHNRPQPIVAAIAADGRATLTLPESIDPATGQPRVLATGDAGPFPPGRARAVELWYVDQEASLWVDGQKILTAQFDLPMETLRQRPPLQTSTNPDIRIDVSGSPVSLVGVELDRDLYYASIAASAPRRSLTATLRKIDGQAQGEPFFLAPDQFFVLGDNSPVSADSRYWNAINPWIVHNMFDDHPVYGVVPRKLMIGRAFFVYWPAAYSLKNNSIHILPNFGDMRFIH